MLLTTGLFATRNTFRDKTSKTGVSKTKQNWSKLLETQKKKEGCLAHKYRQKNINVMQVKEQHTLTHLKYVISVKIYQGEPENILKRFFQFNCYLLLQYLQYYVCYYTLHVCLCSEHHTGDFNGGHVYGMLQSYNRVRLTLSAINLMQIKSLIRNRIITKCLSFDEKAFLILPISSVVSFYFSTL